MAILMERFSGRVEVRHKSGKREYPFKFEGGELAIEGLDAEEAHAVLEAVQRVSRSERRVTPASEPDAGQG